MVYNKEIMEPTIEGQEQEAPQLTRREFLRLGVVATTGAAAAACAPKPTPEVIQTFVTATKILEAATAAPLPFKEKEVEVVPTVKEVEKVVEPPVEPTVESSPTHIEVKPTVAPIPERKPEPTPTAPAVDVSVEIREKYEKEHHEVEAVSPIAFGGAAMSSVWPEKMAERVAEEFVHFRVNPEESFLEIGENTRVLVSLEEGIAGAVLMPWQPEPEGKEQETLAIFASLLPEKLNGGEIEYSISQEVEGEEGAIEEPLHLAVYRNEEDEVTHLLVPFVTPGTIGEEKWEEIGNKIKALKVAGSIEEEQIITAIEGEGEEEKPVMIVLGKRVDEKGGEVLEELLRVELKTIELTEEERERVKEQGLGSFARFKRNEGEYVLWREGEKGEPVEEIIKLWQVPEELREEIPVEPEKPEEVIHQWGGVLVSIDPELQEKGVTEVSLDKGKFPDAEKRLQDAVDLAFAHGIMADMSIFQPFVAAGKDIPADSIHDLDEAPVLAFQQEMEKRELSGIEGAVQLLREKRQAGEPVWYPMFVQLEKNLGPRVADFVDATKPVHIRFIAHQGRSQDTTATGFNFIKRGTDGGLTIEEFGLGWDTHPDRWPNWKNIGVGVGLKWISFPEGQLGYHHPDPAKYNIVRDSWLTETILISDGQYIYGGVLKFEIKG